MSKTYVFLGMDMGREPSQTIMYNIKTFELVPFNNELLHLLEEARRDVHHLFGIDFLVTPHVPPTRLTALNYQPQCNADIKPKKRWKYSGKHPLDMWEHS
jgi:hypothetical protein